MPINYDRRKNHKIDWTKPFRGYNGCSQYEYIRNVPEAGEFCHVIKSVRKKGITRVVNDYGVDIGGQRLISQKLPKPEPKVRLKSAEASNIDTLVLSKKIDMTAEILRGNFVAMREELTKELAEYSFDLRTLILHVLELSQKLSRWEDQKHGRIETPIEYTAEMKFDNMTKLTEVHRVTRNDSVQGYGTQGSLFDETPA